MQLANLKSENLESSKNFNLSAALSTDQNVLKIKTISTSVASDSSCIEIKSLLTLDETEKLIQHVKNLGFQSPISSYPPSYRNNQRMVIDEDRFAEKLRIRLLNAAPPLIVDQDGAQWEFQGINPRFRFCQYNQGEAFFIHQDGVFHKSETEKSFLTLLIYLNDQSTFRGGATRFFANNYDATEPKLIVAPEAGMALLFDHSLWHDGAQILEGTKYVLRSDLIYRRVGKIGKASLRVDGVAKPHIGYVWDAAFADGKFVTGGRDKRIVIWEDECDHLFPEAELLGHQNSIFTICSVNKCLWSGSRDQTIKIWKKNNECAYSELRTLNVHDSNVLNIIHLPSQARVISCDASGVVAIWSEEAALLSKFQAHTNWIWKMVPIGDGLFVTASEDGYLKIWDCNDSRLIASVTDSLDPIWSLSFSGNYLFAGTNKGTVKKIKIVRADSKQINPEITETFSHVHQKGIRSIQALDENNFLSGGEDNKVLLTSILANGKRVHDLIATHHNFATSVRLYRGKVLSTSYDGKILLSPIQHEVQDEN